MQLPSDIQEHFRVKSDGELLSLASDFRDMTSDSRLALRAELQRRLDTTIKGSTSVQLVHGWYTVFAQTANIHFPDLCPNCLRKPADADISVTSQINNSVLHPITKRESITLKVPYCEDCAAKFKHRRRLFAWPSYFAIAVWLAFCIWFNLGRLPMYVGGFLLALPLLSFVRQASAITLGNFDQDWLEFHFRSPDYAEQFALANNVLAQNRETIRDDFLAAIESIRVVG